VNCQPPERFDSEGLGSLANRPGPDDSVLWGDLFLIERLGQGSFGEVYRARDTHLGRDVALKLLRGLTRPDTPSGLIHEGHLLGRIRHPNVVTVYGADCRGGQTGLWMELIAGETLEEELRRRGPFSQKEVAEAGVILSDALSAVHGADLLHRDIKAQNVMRDATGRLVLMDFGAGHVFDQPAASGLVGTPLYVAPEMLRGGSASRQSDIYALGVLLWHLLTNDYPVNGKSLNELRVAHDAMPHLNLGGDDAVDSQLVSILRKCVAPLPTERFSTAVALYDALKQWLVLSERVRTAWSTRFVTAATILLLSSTALIALQVLATRDLSADSDTVVWSARTGGFAMGPPSHDGRLFGCSTREIPVAICDAESGTIQPVQIEETSPPARFPLVYISPDGHRVAYRGLAHHQVTVVDIVTSVSKTLSSVDPSVNITVWSWTPESDSLLVELSSPWNPRLKSSVALMDADTGLLTHLMELDRRTDGTALSFSRRYLAYAQHDDDAYPAVVGRVYVADLETNEIRMISHDSTREPRWLPDDRGVLFVSRHELRLVQLLNGTFSVPKSVLTLEDHAVTLLGVAPSGAVYLRAFDAPLTLHVARFDSVAGSVGPPTTIGQLGAPGGVDWSDDSRFLAFGPPVKGGEKPAIIVKDLASSRDVTFTVTDEIMQDGGGFKDVTVTGDAEFVRVSPGRHEIFVARLGYAYRVNWATKRAQRIADLPLGTSSVEWGADGATLYYAADGVLRAHRAEDGLLQDTLPVTFPRAATAVNPKEWPTTFRLPAYTAVNPKESLIAWTQGEGSSRQVMVSLFAGGRPILVRPFCRGVGWLRKSLFVACDGDLQRGNGPSLNLLNTETGQMQDLKLTVGKVDQIRVRPDGRQLAIATGGREPGVRRIRLKDLLVSSESHTRKLRSAVE
jgi:serine/threonine protein kinase